jgi:PAS domain S-box-containing protein
MPTTRLKVPQTAERLSLGIATLLVVSIGLLAYKAWADFDRRNEQVEITQEIIGGTNALLSSLKDAETGQRGFLLTGEERYLEPYRHAVTEVPALLDKLAVLMASRRPEQAARLERMRPLIRGKLDELGDTIRVQRTQGSAAALAIVRTDRGQADMDQIRAICAEIQGVANTRLTRYSQQARHSSKRLGLISSAGSAAILILLLAATAVIRGGTRQREELIAQATQSRDWLHTTLNSIGDAVIATDANGNVSLLNGVAESLTGWTQTEAAGKPLEQVFVIRNASTGMEAENPVSRVLREGRIVGLANHTRLIARDGRRIPIEDSAAPIRDGGRVSGVVLVFRDVSERLKAEERVRLAVEAAPSAMILVGREGRIELVNSQTEELFGYRREDLLSQTVEMLVPERYRAGHGALRASFLREPRARPMGAGRDLFGLRKDGREVPIEIGLNPIRTSQGDFVLIAVVDISERKRAEERLRTANEELRRSNDDLAQFAFAASHDLQEPLRMITVYSQLLLRRYGGRFDGEAANYIDFITDGTKRMRDLLSDLLAYTQLTGGTQEALTPVDLNDVFRITLENCKAAIEETRAVVTSDALPSVLGHQPHFVQLLQNLVSNGLKYRGDRSPRIHISAASQDGLWRVAVKDNGIGIAPEYHKQIFGVFKRLHGKDIPGTGIGLAICQRVVNRYGGQIWVESEVHQGATFYFTLPPAS